MKTRLLYLGLLLAGPLAGQAQAPRAATPGPISSFFTPDYQPSTASDSTALCAETTFRDSLSGITRVYYPSGKLKQYIPYLNVVRGVRYGSVTTWYENGQMCTKEDYVRGVRHGDLLTYYPDGTLKRREHCQDGRCGVGTCYDANGYPVPYFAYEQLPLYPGGEERLLKELAKAVRLNSQELAAARRATRHMPDMVQFGWRREVDVELAVATDGRVTDARVVQSTAGFLNNAVLRAVAKLQRQFVPGRRDGQVMTSFLTVPLFYTLEAPSRQSYPSSYGSPRMRR
ncbi:energy transducer TonB [Hymenobacter negativus]|uniref:Energy transducer TonB n=1 Tax=Hymenobacter negativus TaxID=2795026 RepID=A0ABS0Q331_9BACT|nr:energy transducer TonB [Hymenobacter negativus]MBH8557048.1 energy transducer TonB [Hymenobacter negativus]